MITARSFAPDEYKKINGVLRWSQTTDNSAFSVTAMGYRGDFDSTDQIPQRLVDEGVIPRDGYVDPTDGGRTYRYTLSTGLAARRPARIDPLYRVRRVLRTRSLLRLHLSASSTPTTTTT